MITIVILSEVKSKTIRGLLSAIREQSIFNKKVELIVLYEKNEESVIFDVDEGDLGITYRDKESETGLGWKDYLEKCSEDDFFIFLKDDTFPKSKLTLDNMLSSLVESEADIISGVWEDKLEKYKPHGEAIVMEGHLISRKPLRDRGVVSIDIPLPTFIAKGECIKNIFPDSVASAYRGMFEAGILIKKQIIDCRYSTSIMFERRFSDFDSNVVCKEDKSLWNCVMRKSCFFPLNFLSTNIKNIDSRVGEKAGNNYWNCIALKYNYSFIKDDKMLTPN